MGKIPSYKKGGLRKKYVIRKIVDIDLDGKIKTKAVDPEADYFVLRLDTDPHAQKALAIYATSVESDNKEFADELTKKLYDYGWEKENSPEEFVKVIGNEDPPPSGSSKNISKTVLVFNKDKKFIGMDSYNHKLKRWMIFRENAVYWLKPKYE
jgi:hypothetical protein